MMRKFLWCISISLLVAGMLGSCGGNSPSHPDDPSSSADTSVENTIELAFAANDVVLDEPIVVSWGDEAGQRYQHSFLSATEQISITPSVRDVKIEVPPSLVMLEWRGPCFIPSQAAFNDASKCEVIGKGNFPRRFTAFLASKEQDGWQLDMLHTPILSTVQAPYIFCTAGTIDNDGVVLIACHHGSTFMPFILEGIPSLRSERAWRVLYSPPSTSGPFLDKVKKIQAIGSASSQNFTDCRAVALTEPDQLGRKQLVCISTHGAIRRVGPNFNSFESFAVADAATNPVLLTVQKGVTYQSSSPGLEDASWSELDLRKKIPGLPPLSIYDASLLSGQNSWFVGSYLVVINVNAQNEATAEYPEIRKEYAENWTSVQALPDGSVWLAGSHGTILERTIAGEYIDRSSTSCGGIPLSIAATSATDVWFAGGRGVCHWDGNAWHETLTDLFSNTPIFLSLSPDGHQLLGLSQGGLVVTREIP